MANASSYRVFLMKQKTQKMGRVFGATLSKPGMERSAQSFGAEALLVDSG
jgi:hypothetical protein